VRFNLFDPSHCGFPRPRVSLLPLLGWRSLGKPNSAEGMLLQDDKKVGHFARGRYALHAAYSLAGVGASGGLLAPSYHCRTMLDPAIRLGAEIRLYPLGHKLAPDLSKIREIISNSQIPIKAILATHYFGMPQNLVELSDLCQEHGISLIEDCAHAIVTGRRSDLIGQYGQYVVSSPYKFFPCADGGTLIAKDENVREQAEYASLLGETKEILISAHRLLSGPVRVNTRLELLDSEIDTLTRTVFTPANQSQEELPTSSRNYVQKNENASGLGWSRWLTKHTDMNRLVTRRRNNFHLWLRAVDGLPHCKPLFNELAGGMVPYMFPLYIDYPEPHFYILKHLGVPIWRWDEMAVSECKIASNYRLNLLHLPCHQELTVAEMEWMTSAVRKVMQNVPV